MWSRPVLCRICECPASDGGVRVDQLDAEKLSEWWRRTIGEEFLPKETPGQGEVICQFCLWDARLEHEYSVDVSREGIVAECDWWSGHDNNQYFHQFYYQVNAIRQFKVMLDGPDAKEELSDTDIIAFISDEEFSQTSTTDLGTEVEKPNEPVQVGSKKVYKCFVCALSLTLQQSLVRHMQRCHPGQFILCKHNQNCSLLFRTEEEKKKHVLEISQFMKKCKFCNKLLSYVGMIRHIKVQHKGENLIRCRYRLCAEYFPSKEAKQKHENLIHAGGNKRKCVFCNLLFGFGNYKRHLTLKHKLQLPSAFKCTFGRCSWYFLTETERDKHAKSYHNRVFVRQEVKCIYCKQVFLDKHILQKHVKTCHSDIKIECKLFGCRQYFHTQTDCEAHFEQQHQKSEENKKFQCSECSYRSDYKARLKAHWTEIHGAKDKQCPKCAKCFGSSEALKWHIRSHKEPKLCQYCKLKFIQLRQHQMQAKCKICQQVLMCLGSAKLHAKICK